MYDDQDTIAAISTGLTPSGIGIVRISGDQAVDIADRVFVTKGGRHILHDVHSHTIHYGLICDGESVLDEVMVSVMKSPRSFTTQDTVEINCHGGVYAMKRVLESVIRAGARPARPGEFTKRAFLGGRIDLTQAESVMDLIESGNEYALENSIHHLQGSLRKKIEGLRGNILYETAAVEAALDDPEHYSLDGYADELKEKNNLWMEQISRLIETFDNGRMIQEGIQTAIVGKPNVGKSSLMNALLGRDRAIVTDVAGTTRDVITEHLAMNGITLVIRDTAGIHHTSDKVESIGIDRALESIKGADLVLCVIDSSEKMDKDDIDVLNLVKDSSAIVILSKSDLEPITTERQIRAVPGMEDVPVLSVSSTLGSGLRALTDKITDMFSHRELSFNDQVIISNVRQKNELEQALESLKALSQSIEKRMPEDFYTIDLTGAYSHLGEITGQNASEDLIDEIFNKFCMGK